MFDKSFSLICIIELYGGGRGCGKSATDPLAVVFDFSVFIRNQHPEFSGQSRHDARRNLLDPFLGFSDGHADFGRDHRSPAVDSGFFPHAAARRRRHGHFAGVAFFPVNGRRSSANAPGLSVARERH